MEEGRGEMPKRDCFKVLNLGNGGGHVLFPLPSPSSMAPLLSQQGPETQLSAMAPGIQLRDGFIRRWWVSLGTCNIISMRNYF